MKKYKKFIIPLFLVLLPLLLMLIYKVTYNQKDFDRFAEAFMEVTCFVDADDRELLYMNFEQYKLQMDTMKEAIDAMSQIRGFQARYLYMDAVRYYGSLQYIYEHRTEDTILTRNNLQYARYILREKGYGRPTQSLWRDPIKSEPYLKYFTVFAEAFFAATDFVEAENFAEELITLDWEQYKLYMDKMQEAIAAMSQQKSPSGAWLYEDAVICYRRIDFLYRNAQNYEDKYWDIWSCQDSIEWLRDRLREEGWESPGSTQ